MTHRPRRHADLCLALLLVAASLGSAFGFHTPGETALAAAGLGAEALAGACHPGLPDHVERPLGKPHPPCPGCLQHLQSRGVDLAPATVQAPVVSAEAPAGPALLLPLDTHLTLPLSRGPPRA